MMRALLGLVVALAAAVDGEPPSVRRPYDPSASAVRDTLVSAAKGAVVPVGDSTVLARGIQCRPGFTAFALKQEWPWSVRAGGLCIMPLADGPWPWPPGRTSGIVIMPRTPFTTNESRRTPWVVVNGILRTELEDARVLVGRTPYPTAKYLAVEGPYP